MQASKLYPAILLFVSCGFVPLTTGHSWIACTDYAEKNAGIYFHDLCRGYARLASQLAPRGGLFGADKGFDHHPSESNPCKTVRDDAGSYDPQHPMAVYYPGQQVVLAHPMKNHGSDECTSRFIPDSGNWIYRGEKDALTDPPYSEFTELVANLGQTPRAPTIDAAKIYPKPGYQNAPRFCDNTNLALGTYSFNVPSDLAPGQYTFMWKWAFNSLQDVYTTCFEVQVVATREERNARLQANEFFNFDEPCGGLTSDGSTMGNSNPGCTNTGGNVINPQPVTTTANSPATKNPTTTTTQGAGMMIGVQALQLSGEIDLPQALQGTKRRFLSVHWGCPVVVNFWNVRVIGQYDVGSGNSRKKRDARGVHYDLMQEGAYEIYSETIYYHAMFTEPCDLLAYPPVAEFIRDEI